MDHVAPRFSPDGKKIVFQNIEPNNAIMAAPLAGGDAVPFAEINGGAHISFSPNRSRIMDVVQHRVLWVSPVKGLSPRDADESVRVSS